jgi:hypothetical protein
LGNGRSWRIDGEVEVAAMALDGVSPLSDSTWERGKKRGAGGGRWCWAAVEGDQKNIWKGVVRHGTHAACVSQQLILFVRRKAC